MNGDKFPSIRPLPESWRKRLRDIVERVRPHLEGMETGASENMIHLSRESAAAVVIKLSPQGCGWQAMVMLDADTVLLFGVTRFQLMHQGQAYEGLIDDAS
jgi:hypothetical protein